MWGVREVFELPYNEKYLKNQFSELPFGRYFIVNLREINSLLGHSLKLSTHVIFIVGVFLSQDKSKVTMVVETKTQWFIRDTLLIKMYC